MEREKVSAEGLEVEFAYSDSGPVPQSSSYTTIVLIHGLCFSLPVFQRLQATASSKGVRVIAFNRRHYPGSTPISEKEFQTLKEGTKGDKDEWMIRHGHHLALFIDALIQKKNLPQVSPDSKTGGVVILGWSLGTGDALTLIAHADTLPSSVRSRLASSIRALIMYEPPPFALGLLPHKQFWVPFIVEGIPDKCKFPMFARWITSYFEHGDLSTRDPNVLEWVLPSSVQVGSIYNMKKAQQDEIIRYEEGLADVPYMHGLMAQLNAAYSKVLLTPETMKDFPNMTITFLSGERGPGAQFALLWAIQGDIQKHGVKMGSKMIPGVNHFIHWDYPDRAIDVFLECAQQNNC